MSLPAAPWAALGALAGRWAGDARGTMAGPTSTECSDRYCSVPAECFRWRSTSRLALHYGVASAAWGATLASSAFYTTVDVAAVQLNLSMDPRHLPGSVVTALQNELKSPVSVLSETDKPTNE